MSEQYAALITEFYRSFQTRQAQAMADCYHPDAIFSDPAFPRLNGAEIGRMWGMLLSRATDLDIEFGDIKTDGMTGTARWQARYTFSATKRPVVNRIAAEFQFKDGKIFRHTDRFDFWNWASQALGPTGLILGWTPMLKSKVQRQAAEGLRRYNQKLSA